MTKGYGILTETSIIAGRDIEDCCSPEIHYRAYKVSLDKNPIKRISQEELVFGAKLSDWTVETNPGIIKTITKSPKDIKEEINKLDNILNKAFTVLKTDTSIYNSIFSF